jgi:hypothetical protein
MARVFAVQVQILLNAGAIQVQVLSEPRIYPRLQSWLLALRSVGLQIISEQEICQGILDFKCVQMSVSGCNGHYKFVLGAGAKAKTVTNNLPILSVLKCVLR